MVGIQRLFCLLPALLAANAAVVGTSTTDTTDWKYAVGWDGVVLDPSAIGTPAMTNATNATDSVGHPDITNGNLGGIYICENTAFREPCGYAIQKIGQCINLGEDWDLKISSMGPDEGTSVEVYVTYNCLETGTLHEKFDIEYPGLKSMGAFNDLVQSFKARVA